MATKKGGKKSAKTTKGPKKTGKKSGKTSKATKKK